LAEAGEEKKGNKIVGGEWTKLNAFWVFPTEDGKKKYQRIRSQTEEKRKILREKGAGEGKGGN